MRKKKRCKVNFSRQHKLFLSNIKKLGFNRVIDSSDDHIHNNFYECNNNTLLILKFCEYTRISFYGNSQVKYEIVLAIKDFNNPKTVKHDKMLNHIMNTDIFGRRKKINKILKNEVFQK